MTANALLIAATDVPRDEPQPTTLVPRRAEQWRRSADDGPPPRIAPKPKDDGERFLKQVEREMRERTIPPLYTFVRCDCGSIRRSTATYCPQCIQRLEARWRASDTWPPTCGVAEMDAVFAVRRRQATSIVIQPSHIRGTGG